MKQKTLWQHMDDKKLADPDNSTWFQEILSSLEVEYQGGWTDEFGRKLHHWLSHNSQTQINTLSLFSGGGGLDIAFHDAGFNIIQMVEIERDYINTLEKNSASSDAILAGSKPVCIDIRDYDPDPELDIDFIIGGPPCQTFSAAGRRAAGVSGTTDPRGTLFEEYVRILEVLQPKGFLFENVYGIVSAQKGQAWADIQSAFKSVGYNIHWKILDAADYGVPQHRERLFIVGLRNDEYLFPYPTHGLDSIGSQPYYVAGEAIENLTVTSTESGLTGRYGHLLNDIPPGLNYSFYTEKMGHPYPVFGWRAKFSDFLYKADPDAPVRTIKAQGGQYTGPFSWENRKFTISELKRLQTFPDDYELVGSVVKSIEQIGNSVPPQIGRILALSILDQIFKVKLPFKMYYMPDEYELGFRKRKRKKTEIYRQKAKKAIEQLHKAGLANKSIIILDNEDSPEESTRYLHVDMRWTKSSKDDFSTKLKIVHSIKKNEWVIECGLDGDEISQSAYVIEITPVGDWILPVTKVNLVAKSDADTVFTGLWKALDEKLAEVSTIADLVQFRGYYQYPSQIHVSMILHSDKHSAFLMALKTIVNRNAVAEQLSTLEIATKLNIEKTEVLKILERLKSMGYEIRNHQTNSQIPIGYFLIPYTFPTLTNRSVQLNKQLS